jgi:hypothetical protein
LAQDQPAAQLAPEVLLMVQIQYSIQSHQQAAAVVKVTLQPLESMAVLVLVVLVLLHPLGLLQAVLVILHQLHHHKVTMVEAESEQLEQDLALAVVVEQVRLVEMQLHKQQVQAAQVQRVQLQDHQ